MTRAPDRDREAVTPGASAAEAWQATLDESIRAPAGDDPEMGEHADRESAAERRQTTLAERDEWGAGSTAERAQALIVDGITQNAETIDELQEDVDHLCEAVDGLRKLVDGLTEDASGGRDVSPPDHSSAESSEPRGYY